MQAVPRCGSLHARAHLGVVLCTSNDVTIRSLLLAALSLQLAPSGRSVLAACYGPLVSANLPPAAHDQPPAADRQLHAQYCSPTTVRRPAASDFSAQTTGRLLQTADCWQPATSRLRVTGCCWLPATGGLPLAACTDRQLLAAYFEPAHCWPTAGCLRAEARPPESDKRVPKG